MMGPLGINYTGDNRSCNCVVEGEEVINAGHIILYVKTERSRSSMKVCAICLPTSAL